MDPLKLGDTLSIRQPNGEVTYVTINEVATSDEGADYAQNYQTAMNEYQRQYYYNQNSSAYLVYNSQTDPLNQFPFQPVEQPRKPAPLPVLGAPRAYFED